MQLALHHIPSLRRLLNSGGYVFWILCRYCQPKLQRMWITKQLTKPTAKPTKSWHSKHTFDLYIIHAHLKFILIFFASFLSQHNITLWIERSGRKEKGRCMRTTKLYERSHNQLFKVWKVSLFSDLFYFAVYDANVNCFKLKRSEKKFRHCTSTFLFHPSTFWFF